MAGLAASPITVRPLRPNDHGAWLDLFAGYIRFYEETVPDDVIALTWQRLLGDDGELAGLVAQDGDGRVVGLVHAILHRSTWSPTWYCYLEDLFVAPAARGLGIGQALIEATAELAKARGATRLYWATKHDNATARRLYDRVAALTPFVQYSREI